jgi:DinB family protein
MPIADEFDPTSAAYVARVEPITDAGGTLESQRERFVSRLSGLSGEQAAFRYAPGKWSITEVIGHVSDNERVFAYRLMRIGRGDDTPLPGFDEQIATPGGAFHRRAHTDLLDEWVTVRNATLSLVRGMPSEAWARYGRANDHLVTARALVYIILGHVEHHLAVLSERYGVRGPVGG